jgi:hypothetical protein
MMSCVVWSPSRSDEFGVEVHMQEMTMMPFINAYHDAMMML